MKLPSWPFEISPGTGFSGCSTRHGPENYGPENIAHQPSEAPLNGPQFRQSISPPTQIRASTLGTEKTSWIGSARLRLIHSSAEAIQYCNPRLITRSCGNV